MRFTVVLVACNVAAYAEKAVRSVLNQSFRDFELLAVSEESSDGTAEILRRAMADDPRGELVQLERSGSASASRNYGIEHAHGDYIVFIDGDDWIEPDALERFDAAARAAEDPDIITAEYRSYLERPGAEPIHAGEERPLRNPGRVCSGAQVLTESLADQTYRSATWRNIYKRAYLQPRDLRQPFGRRHQDDDWTPRVFFEAGRVLISDIRYYNYLKRAHSVTTRVNPASAYDVSANLSHAFAYRREHHFPFRLNRLFARWNYFHAVRFFSPAWSAQYSSEVRYEAFFLMTSFPGNLRTLMSLAWFGGPRDLAFAPALLWGRRSLKCFRQAERYYRFIYGSRQLS